jgi:glycosyltransferase involved in cell wall biosynthesis
VTDSTSKLLGEREAGHLPYRQEDAISMKVVLVHNSYQQPGGEDRVYQVERDLLRAHGHEVVEYYRSNHEIEEYSRIERLMLGPRTVWSSASRRQFTELLREVKPDLVHVHNTFAVISPSIYGACRRRRVPVVQTLHNFRLLCPAATFFRDGRVCHDCSTNLAHGVLHGCYRKSRAGTAAVAAMLAWHRRIGTYSTLVDRYIALTEFAREKFIAGGFEPGKLAVKPNCVYPDPAERESDGSYAVFVGRLETEKGVQTLLAAWRKMGERIPLLLAGAGALTEEVRAATVSMPQVKCLGQIPSGRLFEVIKGARFLVLPSLCYENFPMTLAEAYACGVPVVVSELGAMKEIVAHGSTGLLFRPGDADDLVAKVSFAWNNREYLRRLGRQARKEYESKYTSELNYKALVEIYRSVLPNENTARTYHERTVLRMRG